MTSSSKSNVHQNRQTALMEALLQNGQEGIVLNPGPSLYYLTGLNFHTSERPIVFFLAHHGIPQVVLPEFESIKMEALTFPVQNHLYSEDPSTWGKAFSRAAEAAGLGGKRIGVEPTRLRYLELVYLQQSIAQPQFTSAEESLARLRMVKEPKELAAMRKAVEIAQDALLATLPLIRIGMSERELATELTLQILRAGSDSELPFTPIVSSGPNGANPHATPTERQLQPGDLLVIDWGASHQAYFSDLTRTFSIGGIEPEFARIADIVLQANTAARAKAAAGVPASEVDRAARNVIEGAGYGPHFTHRTGHGLGLEGHEPPYIRADNPLTLEPGVTFTIEPGIYLHGRGGVRIEDDVVISNVGADSLSDLPRQLTSLG